MRKRHPIEDQCRLDGCQNRRYYSKGRLQSALCRGHWDQWRKGEPFRVLKAPPLGCSFDGCDRPHLAHGLCATHHRQRQRGRPLKPIFKPTVGCKVEGCDRKHKSLGYCDSHYWQIKRHGKISPLRSERVNPATCTFPGCDKPWLCRDWCAAHYEQHRKGQKLRPLRKMNREVPDLCSICPKPHHAKGLCRRHYFQVRHRKKMSAKAEIANREAMELQRQYRQRSTLSQHQIWRKQKRTGKRPRHLPQQKPRPLIQPAFHGTERYMAPVGIYGMEGAPFKEFSHLPAAWKACKLTVEEAAWVSGLPEDEVVAQMNLNNS